MDKFIYAVIGSVVLVLIIGCSSSPLAPGKEPTAENVLYVGYNINKDSPASAFAIVWTSTGWKYEWRTDDLTVDSFGFIGDSSVAHLKSIWGGGKDSMFNYVFRAPLSISDYPFDSSALIGLFFGGSCITVVNGQGYFSYGLNKGELSLNDNSLIGVTRDSIEIWNGSRDVSNDSSFKEFNWVAKKFSRDSILSIYQGSKYLADKADKIQLVCQVSDTEEFILVLGQHL